VCNEVEEVSAQAELDIGTDFLGYRVEALIDRGGMGVVYRAFDLRLKRTVALKLMAPELAADDRFRDRFVRESELAMSLEHPNVVPIHDAGEGDGRLYLAMRLVEGTDLRQLLRAEGALEPRRALEICRQVANALDAAHVRGLVHRDVKPSNVLLDRNGHVYLADFGLTRRLEDQGVQAGEGRSVGTPAYLAPEQIEGGSVDGRADVYSLGCLFFECITGQEPFPRDSQLAVAWAHLEEEPPRASTLDSALPGEIDDVIGRAMAKDPDDRYPTCAALVAAAEYALGFRSPPILRRRRFALVSTALILVLAAALAGLFLTRGDGSSAESRLFARANTLARVDPTTRAVVDVISVGREPTAVAAGGNSVWVYDRADKTVSEIDIATNDVRATTTLSAWPRDLGAFVGPVLAADGAGAWIVGVDEDGKGRLTRLRSNDGGRREYHLALQPRAVAVGYGSVWVVGRGITENGLLRIDPGSGRVTARRTFGTSPIDSIALGYGAVWIVGSSSGTLYRVDPHSSERTGEVGVGKRAARPEAVFGSVLVPRTAGGGKTAVVDPREMAIVAEDVCCPPEWGAGGALAGSRWWYDWPTGSVLSQGSKLDPPHSIRVVELTPVAGGPCLTSLAFGSGDVWVTVASSRNLSCRSSTAPVALAGESAEKTQHVVITSRSGVGGFVLTPLSPGVLEPDSGWVNWGQVSVRHIVRDRRQVEINDVDATLLGKRGTLDVHARIEWLASGNGYFIGTGRWTIIRGTHAYARLAGELSVSGAWLPSGPASFRSEGFVFAK
jgi:hypothetical protein